MNNQSISINESEGFSNRTSGEIYYDPKNPEKKAVFQGLFLLPKAPEQEYKPDTEPNDVGKLQTANEKLQINYDEWEKHSLEEGNEIYQINPASRYKNSTRAAVIVKMNFQEDNTLKSRMFVRWTQKNTAKFSNIPDSPSPAIPGFGGLKLDTTVARSEAIPVKPSNVLGGGGKLLKITDVPALLNSVKSHNEVVEQMQWYLEQLANGDGINCRIVGGAKYLSLHQKYTGEWAAPIALITGQFTLNSATPIKDFYKDLMGTTNIKKAKIQYSTSSTVQLIDSEVVLGKYSIGISSKTQKGGGASASLSGLQKTILDPVRPFKPGFWDEGEEGKKNQRFKRIIDIIVNNTAIDGVLILGEEKYPPDNKAIIKENDRENIKLQIRKQSQPVFNTAEWHAKIKELFSDDLATLINNFKTKETAKGAYNLGFHALAAVAKKVCELLNKEDFTDSAKAVLNSSSVVQMSFNAVKQGEDVVCKGFEVIWPSKFTGWVRFHSAKNFYATLVKGKINFKITTNKNERDEPDGAEIAPSSAEDEIEQIKQKKQEELLVGKIVKPGQRDVRDTTVPDVVALGRGMKPKQD